ncbi:MAG: HEPN domain-containing protein [Candidatus Aminicenantes bacterium]|nr:HEPN domain-containing protein [Candidatus Aminicenantes bacterium]MCJ7485925.1 HEPN domain-containing protein [Candidatus Aminicenantes bacterium]
MSYERWLKDRLIKKQAPDHDQINKQLNRAIKDLRTAEAISPIDRTWSFTIAYHAMIRAGRAFMFSKGYLPTTLNTHKTIVEFTREALGPPYGDLLLRFDRMRRKRHDFIYDSENHTTEREALAAIRTAQDLIRRIGEFLGDEISKKLI